LPDLSAIPPPPREVLLRELRARVGELVPGGRVLAEELLGLDSRIDLVLAEPSGRAAIVLVGGDSEGLTLVGRAVAQRAWVEARLPDWLQLAPGLGLRPEAGVRALLLCPGFCAETRAAARALGADALALISWRYIRDGARTALLLQPEEGLERAAGPPRAPAASPRRAASNAPVFRTGLSDADLGLTREELDELERA
jgi:hypothetical protein